MYPENPEGTQHGIYIRHCQESNSQPVPSQAEPIPLGHSDGLGVSHRFWRFCHSGWGLIPVPVCSYGGICSGASFEGAGGRRPQGKRKKEKRERKKKKREKKKERKKGTMNNVKLLHIKCCFFQFFNSPVALKNKKKFWPPQKKLKWRPWICWGLGSFGGWASACRLGRAVGGGWMQCGLVSRGGVDAVFVVGQVRHLGEGDCIYCAFIDLERSFRWVPEI